MPTLRTVTVKSSGGDYTSLSAAVTAEAADLVALDRQLDIVCYSMLDTAQVTVVGYTTDATRYIRIYAPASERHDGKWNTSKYRLDGVGDWTGMLGIQEDYVRVEGLQVRNTTPINNPYNIVLTGAGEVRISGCVLRGSNNGIQSDGWSGTIKVWNNLVYDSVAAGIRRYRNPADGTVICYNNTIIDAGDGAGVYFQQAATLVLRNNLVQGIGVYNNYDLLSNTSQTTSNNVSRDASSPDGASYQSKVVAFLNWDGDDFHLAPSDIVARDAGADLSADANLAFSDDIDGQTRVAPWDIGADEISFAILAFGALSMPIAGTVSLNVRHRTGS